MGGVAVYGDLMAGRLARVKRWAAEQTVADARQRSERRRCGLREGNFGEIGSIARMISGHAATGLRPRKWCPPAGGRCGEVTTVGRHGEAGDAVLTRGPADGGPRGAPLRSKISTMIMRPPQQGHGRRWSVAASAV